MPIGSSATLPCAFDVALGTDVDPDGPCARLTCVDGVIAAANPQAARLLQRPRADLVGRAFTDCLDPASVLLWEGQFQPLLGARGALEGGLLVLRASTGASVPVLVAAATRSSEARERIELALLGVRRREDYEAQLVAARDEAEAARAALADALGRERETAAQLRQVQKMEAVGQLAGGVAHDFNNLLTVIIAHAEEAAATLAGREAAGARDRGASHRDGAATTLSAVSADLEVIGAAAGRAATVVRQLLAFSRQQVLAPGPLDLNESVRRVGHLVPRLLGDDVAWRCVLADAPWPVVADQGQVEQALLNLAINARDAIRQTGRSGTLEVTTANVADAAGAEWVRVSVRDTGVGMGAEASTRAFEPFFTTKGVGEGTGLGLSMVHGIVHQSGGRVRLESAPGAGTTVVLEFPRASAPAPAGPPPHDAPAPPARGSGTVLLVEDEDGVRAVARRILERAGHRVLDAADGEAGLACWRAHAHEIEVLVTDVRMPVLDGLKLRAAVCAERPDLPVVLMSGYADAAISITHAGCRFVEKPFTPGALLAAVDAVRATA